MILVYHADGALKIAPACSKFKLVKAECLALLGRVEVRNGKILFFCFANAFFMAIKSFYVFGTHKIQNKRTLIVVEMNEMIRVIRPFYFTILIAISCVLFALSFRE